MDKVIWGWNGETIQGIYMANEFYVKTILVLYADDQIVLVKSEDELQINIFKLK
jgi:hypothetical protein